MHLLPNFKLTFVTMLKMTVMAQNWKKIMLFSLFIYILLLQHFGYSHPVLLHSANLYVIVCVSLVFSSCGKAGHDVFRGEREYIYVYIEKTISHQRT